MWANHLFWSRTWCFPACESDSFNPSIWICLQSLIFSLWLSNLQMSRILKRVSLLRCQIMLRRPLALRIVHSLYLSFAIQMVLKWENFPLSPAYSNTLIFSKAGSTLFISWQCYHSVLQGPHSLKKLGVCDYVSLWNSF